jgi:hypothetical protein
MEFVSSLADAVKARADEGSGCGKHVAHSWIYNNIPSGKHTKKLCKITTLIIR